MKGLLGYKRGMARIFNDKGLAVPVTVIEAGPCVVTQIKTTDRDGYQAVQLGFGVIKEKRLTQAERGHLRASGGMPLRHVREFRLAGDADVALGDTLDVSVFVPGDRIQVTATSRGLGMAGTIKRHHFHRQRKTHGQSDRERAPGSVGAGTTPGKTIKGLRMSGRMGGERVTVRNLEVIVADPARNLLAVRGAVPGFDGALVVIRGLERDPKGAW
ncbi:MAG: 50S ribosomal protein L3 [Ardenticatenales bacterium]